MIHGSEVQTTDLLDQGESPLTPAKPLSRWTKLKLRLQRERIRFGVWTQTRVRNLRDRCADTFLQWERWARGNSTATALAPMVAEYREEDHGEYVSLIMEALIGHRSHDIHNIALSGGYGVGKSSILTEVADRCGKRVIKISLSTLASADPTTPSSPADASYKGSADTTTNRIQKEIVKQILYSESPSKTSGSRFRRRSVRRWWQGAPMPVAALLTAFGYFSDFTTKTLAPKLWHVTIPPALSTLSPFLPHLWLFLVAFTALHLSTRSLRYSLSIEKLSANAGPAGISLAKPSDTYFDEYLDEIVYYFESTKKDIAIFEDIDRFNDPYIFGALRSLNILLNEAAQLKTRNIRFIYAMKDSIFEDVKKAVGTGMPEANQPQFHIDRTKFFDLVVPVVPFVTHQSARDLMLEAMVGHSHMVSSQLITLVARHIPDMRSIKNVVNEFFVFRNRVLMNEANPLRLSEDKLFAILLYKSVHLKDFEKVLCAESDLDLLYGDYRALISQNIAALDIAEREAQELLSKNNSLDSRAQQLGKFLLKYIDRLVRHVSGNAETRWQLTLDGEQIIAERLSSAEFWRLFLASGGDLQVSLSPGIRGFPALTITLSDLQEAWGSPIDEVQWRTEDITSIEAEIQRIHALRAFLRHADMQALVSRSDLKVMIQDESRSFGEQIRARLKSVLAHELVEAGYIDRYFTLYCSIYHGNHVSLAARKFILHCVDLNTPDIDFELTPSEVDAVLAERGDAAAGNRGMYNICVLERLVSTKGSALIRMLNAIMRFESEEQQFLIASLERSDMRVDMIRALAAVWPGVLTFLTGDNPFGNELRQELFSASIGELQPEVSYEVNDFVSRYLRDMHNILPILTAEYLSVERSSQISRLFSLANVLAPSLRSLGSSQRRALIEAGQYEINYSNLIEVLGLAPGRSVDDNVADLEVGVSRDLPATLEDPSQLCLDIIKENNHNAYLVILRDVVSYLKVVKTVLGAYTVNSADSFTAILNDLVGQSAATVLDFVSLSSPDCVVQHIDAVHAQAWSALAFHQRFPVSFDNVRVYIEEFGVDVALGGLLQTVDALTELEAASEEAKEEVALALLAAREEIPQAERRAELVSSLGLSSRLSVGSLETEAGPLAGWLIAKGIIEDEPGSLSLIPQEDWSGREFAISKSSAFVGYVTPAVLPEGEVERLMQSRLIPDIVKNTVLDSLGEFTPSLDRRTLSAAVTYATQNGRKLSFSEILRAAPILRPSLTVAALLPHVPGLSKEQLVEVLSAIGGEYSTLSDANGKRPRIADGRGAVELVNRLVEVGLVASFKGPQKGEITVNMRRA